MAMPDGSVEQARLALPPPASTVDVTTWRDAVRRRERLLLGLAGLLSVLIGWEIGARTGFLNTLFFSSPLGVLKAAQTEFSKPAIYLHLWTSLSELVVGLALAAAVGIVIGFCAGWFKHANYVLDPWITVLYSTPKVALVPLIILLFGIDFGAKIFVVALMSIFSVIVNTMIGVQAARGQLLDVARTFGASERKQWTSVVLPSAAPFILTGVRLSIGHGMIGVVVAELVAGNHGLGFMIKYAGFTLQSGTVILGVLLIGLWGILSGEVMRRIERRLERWRPT
jgi:ABC-type nitrate/sulfonate/bicarbonate transport system permease component